MFCLSVVGNLLSLLFLFLLLPAEQKTRNLEDVPPLQYKMEKTLAGCGRPFLYSYRRPFAGHAESFEELLSSLPGLVVYRGPCRILLLGSFAALFPFYALPSLVPQSAL